MPGKRNVVSLRTRMVVLFVPAILVILLVAGLFSFYQTKSILRQQKTDVLNNLTEKVETSVSGIIDRAVNTTEMVLYYSPVYDIIFTSEDVLTSVQLEAYREANSYINVLEEQFDFQCVRIFTKNKTLLYQDDGIRFFDFNNIQSEIPVDLTLNNRTDQVKVVDTYLYTPRAPTASRRWQISAVRFLVDGPDMFVRAAVVVDINAEDLLANWITGTTDSYEINIINREGLVLASSDTDIIGTQIPLMLAENLFANSLYHDENDDYVTRAVGDYGWRIYVRLPSFYLYADTNSILTTNLLMIVLACLLSVTLTFVIAKVLTSRLQSLTQTIEDGINQTTLPSMLDMQIREQSNDYKEIGVLVNAYNRLLERIGQLSEENEQIALSESRYRMEAFRLQINAHFLYNTLASIKGYIEMNDRETASDLLMKMADFFNCSLDRYGYCIKLREEIKIIQIYLSIQELVYADQFDWSIDIPEEMMDMCVPKFILQPVIENALTHGVWESEEHGRLTVTGEVLGDRTQICISDNGPGFNREMLANRTEQRRGIGIRNVRARLALYFGGKARLWVENPSEGGGRVVVELPSGGLTEKEAQIYNENTDC